jgi:hypothetical protein
MKPFRCRSCKAELGQSNGQMLIVGPVVLLFKTTFRCRNCGGMCQWRPVATQAECEDPGDEPKSD